MAVVNIGTAERPCMVPEKAILAPQSPEENLW